MSTIAVSAIDFTMMPDHPVDDQTVLVARYPPSGSDITVFPEGSATIPAPVIRAMATSYCHLAFQHCNWQDFHMSLTVRGDELIFEHLGGSEQWGLYHPGHQERGDFTLTLTGCLMDTFMYRVRSRGDSSDSTAELVVEQLKWSDEVDDDVWVPALRFRADGAFISVC